MSPSALLVPRRPSAALGWTAAAAVSLVWIVCRLFVFRSFIFPLTYALPLLLCIWTCDRRMLWTMAGTFAVAHTAMQFWLLPAEALPPAADWASWTATMVNILVGGAAVQAIIALRERLEGALDELAGQSEELERQNEELSQQSEELSGQSEELTQQVEELSQQSEEIQLLASELEQRERLLQSLLDTVRLTGEERPAIDEVCRTALRMFGSPVTCVRIFEQQAGVLVMRAAAGTASADGDAAAGACATLARVAIDEDRTACLNDLALRPDLASVGGGPIQPGDGVGIGSGALDEAADGRLSGSVLASPMRAAGQPLGALVAYGSSAQQWTVEQFRLSEWLARQAADILHTLRLQQGMRRQAALLDLSPDATIMRSMEGRISMWSAGAEALYGWGREEAIGKVTHSLFRTRFPEPLEAINARLRERGRWSGELIHTAKDGREVVVESRWLLEREGGLEVLESNVDITERKRTEALLRADDLRKNQFLATLSHELRNPLAPIRYAIDLLKQPDEAGAALRAREVIERQVAHLVRLVDDLLDLTRIASNKVQLRTELILLSQVIEQVTDTLRPDVRAANHELSVSLPDEPVWLEADGVRLSQVFTNLLINAIRYTPSGGRIALRVTADGRQAQISVTDNGVGLMPRDLERVFEMFEQVGRPNSGGLGIGLALVKGLVELHGGTVEARSAGPGRGAEFVVRLPRAHAPTDVAQRDQHGTISTGPRRRVLIVDDNVDSADMLRTFLELDGHEVQVAYDAASALEKMSRLRPDVGLFDIGLPGMSGYELAERVRSDPRNGSIYLVAVTGWGQDGDRERARRSGFDAHLTKPPAPETIRKVVSATRQAGGMAEQKRQ